MVCWDLKKQNKGIKYVEVQGKQHDLLNEEEKKLKCILSMSLMGIDNKWYVGI